MMAGGVCYLISHRIIPGYMYNHDACMMLPLWHMACVRGNHLSFLVVWLATILHVGHYDMLALLHINIDPPPLKIATSLIPKFLNPQGEKLITLNSNLCGYFMKLVSKKG